MKKKLTTTQHIIRGCGYLHICGTHPGTFILGFMLIASAAYAGIVGFLGVLLFFGPMYLYGAYTRSVYDQDFSDEDT